MNRLVEDFYKKFPEFDSLNDHIDDESEYLVFGNFGLFLCDLIVLDAKEELIDSEKKFFFDDQLSFPGYKDSGELIARAFQYINDLLNEHDSFLNDIIFTTIFFVLTDIEYTDNYALKYFDNPNYNNFKKITNDLMK